MVEDDEIRFETSGEEKRYPPLMENEDHGITLWADEDKNGNIFFRLKLPLGMGRIPVFVNDAAYPGIQEYLNQLVEKVREDRD